MARNNYIRKHPPFSCRKCHCFVCRKRFTLFSGTGNAMLYGGRALVLLVLISGFLSSSNAQGSAGSSAQIEPRYLIDAPTAGMIRHGQLAFDMDFYRDGGLLTGVTVGIFNRLLFGISYGASGMIGSGSPEWNAIPGFQIRLRILNESVVLPAFALGFDSQGKEIYNRDLSRYSIKSRGIYVVLSKNYRAFGNLSFHGGANYSFERADGDKDPDLFIGVEKSLGASLSILAEYDVGLNDSHQRALGQGRGYLNLSARASLGKGFSVGFNMKDLLKNQREVTVGSRTVVLEYVQTL